MAPTKHAVLSASSAHRWLACPPSARLEESFPNTTSPEAEEGTFAHSLVEERLSRIIKGKPRGKASATKKKNIIYQFNPGIEEYVDEYVDVVMDVFNRLKVEGKSPLLFSERKVDFSEWVPDGFGTTDTVIIANGTMYVFDFKYGKGVRVVAEDNPQLRLYALGAYNEFSILYDIDTVVMYIVQPRIEDGVTFEEMPVYVLEMWAKNIVAPTAMKAYNGEGEAVEGDHCRFCRAKAICKARALRFLEFLKETEHDPKTLSSEQLATLLPLAKKMAGYAKEIEDYMQSQALAGEEFPGYKLVHGRSTRLISDEAKAGEILSRNGFTNIYSLKGITTLEGIVGKAKLAELIGDLIEKPEGKPTLVPESDKRPKIDLDLFKDTPDDV